MEKNKKIILFMPAMEGGGVEKNIIIISNYLSKYLKNVTLITYDARFKYKFSKKVNLVYIKENSYSTSKYLKYFFCCILLIKEILKNKKITVLSFQANIYCLIISKFLNFNVIVRSNSSPSGWSNNKIKKILFKTYLNYSRKIIVNSKDFKKELDKKFNTNSLVIYNPLNKSEIIKMSKKIIKNNFFQKGNLKLINIARFTDQKDHLTLLKAVNLLKNKIKLQLLIIGYGSNEFLIRNYIKDNNLNSIVKVIGFQKNPYKYLKKADMLILSSIFEGAPNVILEALCLKKIVISSDCPTGPKEILQNGKYGFLFKPKNYNQLASLIIYSSKNKKLIRRKILLGFNSLVRFDYKKNCNKYLNVIKQII